VLLLLHYLSCRILANYQQATRPATVGFWGLLQPFADELNLYLKEIY
jgi:NADH:ubiquinone oxidoreductase subunit H